MVSPCAGAANHKAEMLACVVSSLCPVAFCSQATLHLRGTGRPFSSTNASRELEGHWSHVLTGSVDEQRVFFAAVRNAIYVHSLQGTAPNPLSCQALTPNISLYNRSETTQFQPIPTSSLMKLTNNIVLVSLPYAIWSVHMHTSGISCFRSTWATSYHDRYIQQICSVNYFHKHERFAKARQRHYLSHDVIKM